MWQCSVLGLGISCEEGRERFCPLQHNSKKLTIKRQTNSEVVSDVYRHVKKTEKGIGRKNK